MGNGFEMRGLVSTNYDLRVRHTSSEMQYVYDRGVA